MSPFDHTDIKYTYSLGWFLVNTLKKLNIEVITVGPYTEKFPILKKIKQKLYRIIFKKKYWRHRDVNVLKSIGRQVSQKLNTLDFDAVFAFGSLNTAFVTTDKPIYYLTDSIFQGLLNYYETYSQLSEQSIRDGELIEKDAIARTKRVFVSSEWALNTIKHSYPEYANKVCIAELGANLLRENQSEAIQAFIANRFTYKYINFVFIGYNWLNKGGHEAIAVIDILEQEGIKCRLSVLGPDSIPENDQRTYVNLLGKVNKFSDDGFEVFDTVLKEAHFFILPSKFEAFGHVFCEANSYGVPCIGNKTGGITTVIKDGINGKVFNFPNEVQNCADYLMQLINNHAQYTKLCASSYNEYKQRLNWKTCFSKIIQYIEEDIKKQQK